MQHSYVHLIVPPMHRHADKAKICDLLYPVNLLTEII